MPVSLESASKFKQQSRATSFPTACAGRVRDRAEYDTGNPGAQAQAFVFAIKRRQEASLRKL